MSFARYALMFSSSLLSRWEACCFAFLVRCPIASLLYRDTCDYSFHVASFSFLLRIFLFIELRSFLMLFHGIFDALTQLHLRSYWLEEDVHDPHWLSFSLFLVFFVQMSVFCIRTFFLHEKQLLGTKCKCYLPLSILTSKLYKLFIYIKWFLLGALKYNHAMCIVLQQIERWKSVWKWALICTLM